MVKKQLLKISVILSLWLFLFACPFALCRDHNTLDTKSTSLRFRFDSQSKGTFQENLDKAKPDSKHTISSSTVFEYTLHHTGSEIEVIFHNVNIKAFQDDREMMNNFMSRDVYRTKKDGQWEVIQANEADSKLRRMLNDSFESPMCRITVDDNGKEIKRIYLARIGAMTIINESIVENARIFHAPFPKGSTKWDTPVAIPTGNGNTAKGMLTYEVMNSGVGVQPWLIPVKVSGEAAHERKAKNQVLKTHYDITGTQVYNTKVNEWVEGEWQVLLTTDLFRNDRKEGTSSITMTNILSLLEESEKDALKHDDNAIKGNADDKKINASIKTDISFSFQSPHLSLEMKTKGWVKDACFSPNGDYIASTDKGGYVKIWETKTGTCISTLNCGTPYVNYVCFSPDGKLVASGDEWLKVVKIWDVYTGQCLQTIDTKHSKNLHDICFSPDGKYVVSASDDKTLKLWNVNNGSLIRSFSGHDAGVFCVAFSPDGRNMASGSWDQTIRLWDVETGKEIKLFKGHTATVECVTFSADGTKIASCEWFGDMIVIWNVCEGYQELQKRLLLPKCVEFSPDGNFLAIGDSYGQVHIMSTKNSNLIKKFKAHEKFLAPVVEINALHFSPDGKHLLSAADDEKLKIWSFE